MDAQRAATGIEGRLSRRIDDRKLSVGDEAPRCDKGIADRRRAKAPGEQIEADLSEFGIGDVLACHRADIGADMHAPRRNGGARTTR